MGATGPASPPRTAATRRPTTGTKTVAKKKKLGTAPKGPTKTSETLTQAQDILDRVETIEKNSTLTHSLQAQTAADAKKIADLEAQLKVLQMDEEKREAEQKKKLDTIGIIRIQYDYDAIAGDVDSDDSFEFRTRKVMCAGLTFERAQKGYWDEEIAVNMKRCVEQLESLGVVGITGDCGFMQYYQNRVGNLTNLPVYLSSLMQCAQLASVYQDDETVLVLTANSESLTPEALSELLTICHLDKPAHDRFKIMGCQDVDGFEAVANGDKVDKSVVRPALVKRVGEVLAADQSIKCLLLECTELPAYGDALRKAYNIPVFDAVTLINHMHSGRSDNPEF
eukprot:TRINITY_DN921_c0_g1_i1.p1 TRINITY_DN921_c0_g1~~TRINITY_DN921_c0_g1_i1.p1  ORF type:complete len:338 (+),score=82.28 TRINITY_DN921_c0_g1_i1:75-1088(+)